MAKTRKLVPGPIERKSMRNSINRPVRVLAAAAATVLLMAACAGADSNSGDSDGDQDPAGGNEQDAAPDDDPAGADDEDSAGTITMGIIPSWPDGVTMAHLWQEILQDEGYNVVIQEITDAAPLFTAVSNGDIDVYPSAWSRVAHANYLERFGDDLVDLATYNDNAELTLAVPAYTDATSIADLNDIADDLDNRIVGIEAGAGMMELLADTVMPTYGLDENFELVESSTAAMLSELQSATDAGEDIVVTFWRPFWANDAFDIRHLDDPEGAWGESDSMNIVANADWVDEHPEVADMMRNFRLDNELYDPLEDMIVNEYQGNEAEGARAWLEQHPDFVAGLQD